MSHEEEFTMILRKMGVLYESEPTTTGTVHGILINDQWVQWYFDHDGKFIGLAMDLPPDP